MSQFIVIPIYDHTTTAEVREILQDLDRLGFAQAPYLVEGEQPRPSCADCGKRPSIGVHDYVGLELCAVCSAEQDRPDHPDDDELADIYSDLPPSGSTKGV
jgi:hypothetical protein